MDLEIRKRFYKMEQTNFLKGSYNQGRERVEVTKRNLFTEQSNNFSVSKKTKNLLKYLVQHSLNNSMKF